MTCVIAVRTDTEVVIGADSAASAGDFISILAEPKVFEKGPYLIGYSGAPRFGQILRYSWSPPVPPVGLGGEALTQFMATEFIDSMRDALKRGGHASMNASSESTSGSFAMVVVNGRIYSVQANYQLIEDSTSYMAMGSGRVAALGALYATESVENPRERVVTCLRASEACTMSVRGPFNLISHSLGGQS